MLREKRGISLTTMVITVMIMFIIMGTLVYSAIDSIKIRRLNRLYNDLRQIGDAVEVYYLKNGELPVQTDASKTITITKDEDKASVTTKRIGFVLKDSASKVADQNSFVNPNDYVYTKSSGDATYKYLNLSLLSNISLNYPTNEFIVNTQSHTIYNITGLTIDGKTYNYLPLTYTNTKFNEKKAASTIRLKPLDGISSGTNIYFSLSSDQIDLKDLLEFDSEEVGDGLGEPKDLNFNITSPNDYYTIDQTTGVLKRKGNGIINASDSSSDYNSVVTVSATNYGEKIPSVTESFTISTSSIDIYSTERQEPIDHINLVKKQDGDTYVYQKTATGEKEYKIVKNGRLSGENDINIVPKIEDAELVSATYNNNLNSSDKYVVFESKEKVGYTDVTMEVQGYGLARDTVTVNVFKFEIYEGQAGSNTNISKLNFGGLGEDNKTNVKLNFEAPNGFKFDGITNKVEWAVVGDDGIISLTNDSDDTTKTTVIPSKIGKTALRCSVIIEGEKISEMLIPVTVSGVQRTDGQEISDNKILLPKNGDKTVSLKYVLGDTTITSYTLETPTVVPATDFTATLNSDNTITVSYSGTSDITAVLTITVKVGEESFTGNIDIIVS